jgi:3',5'-cyclic-AMP phosphodiesterase
MLLERAVDHVVVSGDVTHRGRRRELERFREIFAPLEERGRLSIIPATTTASGTTWGQT